MGGRQRKTRERKKIKTSSEPGLLDMAENTQPRNKHESCRHTNTVKTPNGLSTTGKLQRKRVTLIGRGRFYSSER